MPYRAVIFDLFGTLVVFSPTQHQRALEGMMEVLGLSAAECGHLWHRAYERQELGEPIEDTITWVCHSTGVIPDPDGVSAAAKLWWEFQRGLISPTGDVTATLEELRARGYKIGLISNCPAEVPTLWRKSPPASLVDVALFSSECGLRKPDPRIYQEVCRHLQVPPQQCIYVGDGGSDELPGANAVGMHAVLFDPAARSPNNGNAQRVVRWCGSTITRLGEVLDLIHAQH